MDLTNINDPAGVKALLEQLQQSPAWQESIASITQDDPPPRPPITTSADDSQKSSHKVVHQTETGSVAALLSLLQPSLTSGQDSSSSKLSPNPPQQHLPSATAPSRAYNPGTENKQILRPPPQLHTPPLIKQDLRSCSFQQALPHLASLSSNPEFKTAVSHMKKEQGDLEQHLWNERRAILQKHESKVKVAITKANLTGSEGLTQYEADVLTDACRKELTKFDLERVMPAWDGLMTKQQTMLQSLNCPSMYVTNMTADMRRQQRIMQVLEGIVNGDENRDAATVDKMYTT